MRMKVNTVSPTSAHQAHALTSGVLTGFMSGAVSAVSIGILIACERHAGPSWREHHLRPSFSDARY